VVDAMNVIGSRPDGWWRDRDGALRRLAARLQTLATAESISITLVADGRPLPDLPDGVHDCVLVLYASRGGRNAADDRIVEFIAAQPDPTAFEVVTSDRDLSERVKSLGARVVGVSWLLDRLDTIEAQ
jgi:hypothetical protein